MAFTQELLITESKLDLLQGTLDVMVLQTLLTMGAMHGCGIARRIEQVSGDEILLNQGTIYASLVRLQQRGWIAAEWGTSDNNRKAKFYSITRSGRKQFAEDAAYWQRLTRVMGRVLAVPAEGELSWELYAKVCNGYCPFFISSTGTQNWTPRLRRISNSQWKRICGTACLRKRLGVRR